MRRLLKNSLSLSLHLNDFIHQSVLLLLSSADSPFTLTDRQREGGTYQ